MFCYISSNNFLEWCQISIVFFVDVEYFVFIVMFGKKGQSVQILAGQVLPLISVNIILLSSVTLWSFVFLLGW